MKESNGYFKLIRKIMVFLFFVSASIMSIAGITVSANSYDDKSENELLVIENDNAPFFSEVSGLITPMWFTFEPILANAKENYEHIDFAETQKKYRGGTVIDRPINEEKYGLFGVDATQTEVRLVPVNSLSAGPNINANGGVSLSIKNVAEFPSPEYIVRWNDTRKLNELYGDIVVTGNGKILYRTAPFNGSWGAWSNADLNYHLVDYTRTLYFPSGCHVQIVVIYEVREQATWFMVPHVFYHVRGIYRFSVYQ
jgi:hypothetical protein